MRKHYASRTMGAGNTKNRRGKGSRGGVGRAGFHKHKRLMYLKLEGTSTTAPGFVNDTRRHITAIGLNKLALAIETGKFKNEGGAYTIDLRQKRKLMKVLGNGNFPFKANITANIFSESAKEAIEKAGGKAIVAKGEAGKPVSGAKTTA